MSRILCRCAIDPVWDQCPAAAIDWINADADFEPGLPVGGYGQDDPQGMLFTGELAASSTDPCRHRFCAPPFTPEEVRKLADGPKPPTRYLVCEDWGHIFHDLYGEETVRWVVERYPRRVIAMQIRDRGTGNWLDLWENWHDDVTESLDQNGVLSEPEEWEQVVQTDEMPDWSCREHIS
jgi:hypothetical protein